MSEKSLMYSQLATQAEALLSVTGNPVANAANLSALIFNSLAAVNWVGFYFLHEDKLLVGPFQGQPACVEIPIGKGVCGTAASSGAVQRVANVHDFPGHIACDVASKSEIVIPLLVNEKLIGVLDIDSPEPSRFDLVDQQGLVKLAEIYLQACNFNSNSRNN